MNLTFGCDVSGVGSFTAKGSFEPGTHWSMFARRAQPKILGVHAYVGKERDGCLPVRIRVSNGAVASDGTKHCGGVFYTGLWVDLPPELQVYAPQLAGSGIVGPRYYLALPGLHYFPSQRCFTRTLIFHKPGSEQAAVDLYRLHALAIPAIVSDFGPLNVTLPKVNRRLQAKLARQRVDARASARASGAARPDLGFNIAAMGPWYLSGDRDAMAVGGQEIEFCEGVDQSVPGVLEHLQEHDDAMQRASCMFDIETGRPIGVDEFAAANPAGTSPDYSASKDPYVSNGIVPFFKQPDFGQPNGCPYDDELVSWKPVFITHFPRMTGDAMAAWEATRKDPDWSWIAESVADDILLLAHEARMVWSDKGELPHQSGWVPRNLTNRLAQAKARPGWGGYAGREFGWAQWVGAMAIKILATTGQRIARKHWGAWAEKMLEFAQATVMSNGVMQRGGYPDFGNGVPYQPDTGGDGSGAGVPKELDVAQGFEFPIAWSGSMALVGQTQSERRKKLVGAFLVGCDNLYLNPALPPKPPPADWSQPQNRGASKYVAVAPHQGGTPFATLTQQFGPGDPAHVLHALALAEWLSGDEKYLDAMLRYDGPAESLEGKLYALKLKTDLSWSALALWRLQEHFEPV